MFQVALDGVAGADVVYGPGSSYTLCTENALAEYLKLKWMQASEIQGTTYRGHLGRTVEAEVDINEGVPRLSTLRVP